MYTNCTYPEGVGVEWDSAKADANSKKHGVDFAEAVIALTDEGALTIAEEVRGEERFVTLGLDTSGRLLVVVYTMRSDIVRLISARRATRCEREQYGRSR
jgi:uncharacterized DUF497 family protein